MHPSEIKSALAKAGMTQRQVAVDADVKETVVSAVLNGKARSKRVEERIGKITNIPMYRLWPQWYDAPPGVEGALPIGGIDLQLLHSIESQMETTLMRYVPGLKRPFKIKVRHRVLAYNLALKNGPISTETGAGIADVVEGMFAPYDGFPPDTIAQWALASDGERADESVRKGASGTQPPKSNQVIVSGTGNTVVGRDKVGVQINDKRRR